MSESASSAESPLVLRPQPNLAAYACDLADRLTRYEQLDRSHGLPGEEYNPWTDLIARHPFYDEAATLGVDPLWHCDRVVLSDAENSLMVVHDKLTNQWVPHQGRIEGPSREQAIAVLLRRSQERLARSAATRAPANNRPVTARPTLRAVRVERDLDR